MYIFWENPPVGRILYINDYREKQVTTLSGLQIVRKLGKQIELRDS